MQFVIYQKKNTDNNELRSRNLFITIFSLKRQQYELDLAFSKYIKSVKNIYIKIKSEL